MSQRLRSVPGRTKTKAFAVIARNAGEAETISIFGRAYGRMSRRRGEITGLMNELPRLLAHNYRPADCRFFVAVLIFFVFFVLEASVSPEGASDAIGTSLSISLTQCDQRSEPSKPSDGSGRRLRSKPDSRAST